VTDKPFISIDGRRIGENFPPYVVAELSANHNGSVERARAIIDSAKAAGADAIKLQTYRPDTITLDFETEDFMLRGGLWDGRSLYDLYREAHMPWEWHAPLFEHAHRLGITIFSSPFDTTAIDLLEDLNAPAYKIASFEVVDTPLIRYAASTGKPLIISTGLADAEEIAEAVETARSAGCKELALLHCVSAYPAPASDYNLRTLADMVNRFDLVTGLSDHTIDNTTAVASVALGCSLIEKHFTLDRSGGGPDDSFSLQPDELAALCKDARTAWSALGAVDYGLKSSERSNLKWRRSLYVTRDVVAGESVAPDNVRSVRPGFGLPPKYLDAVIGVPFKVDVRAGTALSWEHVDASLSE
jgi:pseudaminic acid synthase